MRRGAAACVLALAGAAVGCALGNSSGASDRDGVVSVTTGGGDGGTDGGTAAGSATGATGGGTATGGGGTGGTGGIGGAPPGPPDAAQAVPVHFVGRFAADPTRPGAYQFAWSASALLARFDGPAVTLTLNEAVAADAPLGNYFDVTIDGVPASLGGPAPGVLVASRGVHDYVLAQNLAAGPHDVRVRRRTEARAGVSEFVAMLAPGGQMVPFTRAVTRAIWVIGDSISAGYGIEGASSTCSYSTATESASEAYGVVAADLLAADVQVTAWAGKGVIRNSNGGTDLMPALALRTLPADPNSGWDPNTFAPGVVVINLGTNDFAAGTPPQASFVAAYQALLDNVRRTYPAAWIVCALGPMLSDSDPPGGMALSTARAFVQAAIAAAADPQTSYLEFAEVPPASQGCGGHPDVAAQASMGQQLAAEITARTGWQQAASTR